MGARLELSAGRDADRVGVLIAAGADPNVNGSDGASMLATAARSGDSARVELLLAAGADPMPACVEVHDGVPWLLEFRDPLMMAARSGSVECVRLLLDVAPDMHRYPDNESPLAVAGSLAVVELLLSAGADPNQAQPYERSIVDHVAARSTISTDERAAMVHALCAAGAGLDGHTFGTPALFGAAVGFDDDAVEVLLRAGADPFIEPTALQGVCFSASSEPDQRVDRIIDLLIAAGFDIDAPDAAGFRPLDAAMADDRYGPGYEESDGFNEAATLALIRAGANIDVTEPDRSFRPLHIAAAAGSHRVVRALLAVGADPTERSRDGLTPIDIARRTPSPQCVHELERPQPGI